MWLLLRGISITLCVGAAVWFSVADFGAGPTILLIVALVLKEVEWMVHLSSTHPGGE